MQQPPYQQQPTFQQQQNMKNPTTAFILELLGFIGFLGIGHIYVGQTVRGVLMLIGWLAYIFVGPVGVLLSGSLGSTLILSCLFLLALILVPILSGMWAMNTAKASNMRVFNNP